MARLSLSPASRSRARKAGGSDAANRRMRPPVGGTGARDAATSAPSAHRDPRYRPCLRRGGTPCSSPTRTRISRGVQAPERLAEHHRERRLRRGLRPGLALCAVMGTALIWWTPTPETGATRRR
jgi:hypothetical protein